VAAASILARNEFVTRLGAMEKQYGVAFPKGASAAVDKAAAEFFGRFGVEELKKVAKMHFRTALRAQGLPEPPKVEWRKPTGKRADDRLAKNIQKNLENPLTVILLLLFSCPSFGPKKDKDKAPGVFLKKNVGEWVFVVFGCQDKNLAAPM